MNIPSIVRIVGVLLTATSVAMAPPAAIAVGEGLGTAWAGAIAVTIVLGVACIWSTPSKMTIDHRAGLVVVGLGWMWVVAVGSLPFVFTGVAGATGALFESASGFTTTGATIFPVVEDLPRSILLWRSISHWIGGMGIIVLGVAILPFLGVGGAQLFRAEAPGIPTDRLTPRIASTARLLWGVYVLLTSLLTITYLVLGMSVFDAVNHAMSALATGGFSTRTTSMAAFSPAIQWVTIGFMFLAGVNFTLHYQLLAGRWGAWVEDIEWRTYAAVIGVVIIVCFVAVGTAGGSWSGSVFRDSVFNVVSVVTTTGFATADFAAWPLLCQVILLGLMFVGAMGGSTGGGLKVARAVVLAKHTLAGLRTVLHPRAIIVTRLGRHPIRQDVLLNVIELFALYIATHALGTLLLSAMGYDFMTSVSAALAAMSSIGPGLGTVGPASHYGDMSWGAHLVLTILMLLGRLEFYTLLVVFLPETWALALRNGKGESRYR